MARTGVLEETETETESDSSMVVAKAMEIKKQLERLVKAIVDEDDYRVETTDEAIRALSSLKGLKLKKSLSFKLDGHGNLLDVPEDFRCPISGELMKDPVVLATGQVTISYLLSPFDFFECIFLSFRFVLNFLCRYLDFDEFLANLNIHARISWVGDFDYC